MTAIDGIDEPVFRTPHSTDWHRQIAEENTILQTQVGSGLHGVTVKDHDDRDEMGICIEPPEVALNTDLLRFEQYEYRTKPVGARSGPGDLDLTIYGLRKYVRLAAAGNPTILMPLFAPESEIVTIREPGRDLRWNRHMLLSKAAGRRFLGYLDGQRKHLVGENKPKVNRPELVEAYGYDVKYAYHALRIGLQGTELMTDGCITLPMNRQNRALLIDVRHGKYELAFCLDMLDKITARLTTAMHGSELPDRPNYDQINLWVADTYRRWWAR